MTKKIPKVIPPTIQPKGLVNPIAAAQQKAGAGNAKLTD